MNELAKMMQIANKITTRLLLHRAFERDHKLAFCAKQKKSNDSK